MNLEFLFEDLEAQFESELANSSLTSGPLKANLLRVHSMAGVCHELVMPLLGKDFTAGIDLNLRTFKIIRNIGVDLIDTIEITGEGLPACRQLDLATAQFCERLPLPAEVIIWRRGAVDGRPGLFLGVVGDHLIIELSTGAHLQPVSTIEVIELLTVDNLDD